MRKFRFIGNPSEFDWDVKPIEGNIYPETLFGTKNGIPYDPIFESGVRTQDWQEVTEPEAIQLPSLTKREYFAGLAMAATNLEDYANTFGNEWASKVAHDSILLADELLKQLENGK